MNAAPATALPDWFRRLTTDHGLWVVLILAAAVLLAGFGLRDPWPADEPRFAAIARDMLATGDWLVPRVGGAIYADKPPIEFWLMGAGIWLTGSLRLGFMLPGIVAGFVTVFTVYDLTRRLYSANVAFWAGVVLLATFQFSLEFKSAQIDPVVTMLITVGMYGLLRHLLLGPSWSWYALGGFASGIGVATKGVGFLPLLVLLPYVLIARRGWVVPVRGWNARWLLAPGAALLGIAIWLVPLVGTYLASPSPELEAYIREILLGQTVGRYVDAAGHLKPWWYFILAVIPWAWMPVSLALPWLARHWRAALAERDTRIALLLGWIVLVVLFFSLSSGKRGVYVLPATPALAIATAPYVEALLQRRLLNWLAFAVLVAATAGIVAGIVYLGRVEPGEIEQSLYGFTGSPVLLIAPFAVWAALCVLAFRPRRGLTGLAIFFLGAWVTYGAYLWPRANVFRSGRIIMEHAYERLPEGGELGIAAHKESLILHAHGKLTNFGHRRVDREQEEFDAALWLAEGRDRYLILPDDFGKVCFDHSSLESLGFAHGNEWLLATPETVNAQCALQGRAENAIDYVAPNGAEPNPLSLSEAG